MGSEEVRSFCYFLKKNEVDHFVIFIIYIVRLNVFRGREYVAGSIIFHRQKWN